MGDIFDQAAKLKQPPTGDIFDQAQAATPAPPPETATDRLFKGMGTAPATISAAPTGVNAWLSDAENDLRHGGQSTFIGKMLHAAGANPNGVDSGTGSYAADTVASVPLGLLHAAQGVAQTPEHPVMGPLHALGGALQTLTVPASFVAPETQALKDASLASKARQVLLPTTEEAGKLFQPIEAAAKSTPVKTDMARAIAEEAQKYGNAGASGPPKVLTRFLARTAETPMNPQSPVFYPEARKFAENAGRLSASEKLALNPQMDRLVSKFAAALKTANRAAADEVGMAPQYDEAMRQYAGAANRAKMLDKVKDVAKDAVIKLAIGGAIGAGGVGAYKTLAK